MKFILSFFGSILLLFSACAGTDNGYSFKGNIKNAENLQVVLELAHFDRSTVALGKAAIDASGNFTITQEKPWEEGLYRLSIGAKRIYFMLDGKEKEVSINADLANIEKMGFEIKGSETFQCYANLIGELLTIGGQLQPDQAKAFVAKSCNPMMKAFMGLQLYGATPAAFMTELKQAGTDLTAYAPNSKFATDYNAIIAQVGQQAAQQDAAEKIKVGEMAPEISLPGPDGKVHSLSSLKGKVVLLDFWASWCGPCRKANPHVVEVYNKYKSRGFDVFSVSLDGADPRQNMPAEEMARRKSDGKAKWVAAIEQDKLAWPNHVSDLQHWGSAPAAVYGVNSIPRTFLIDRTGKIIAVNPRNNLEQEVLKAL